MNISQIELDLIQEWTEEMADFDSLDWVDLAFNVEEFVGRDKEFQHAQLDALVAKVYREHRGQFDAMLADTNEETRLYMERIAKGVQS